MNRELFIFWIIQKQDLFISTAKKHLHGFLKSMAEDVAQDAILQMLKIADTFEGTEHQFDSYANRTVRSKCIDLSRKSEYKCSELKSDFSFLENQSSGTSALDELIRNERVLKTRKALLKLRRKDRQIILLRVQFDCSNRQIANRLGISEKNVSQTYKRAFDRLAEIIGPDK